MTLLGQACLHKPQPTHFSVSTWAVPSTTEIAPVGHTAAQSPKPRQP